jgi:hypothetical protein
VEGFSNHIPKERSTIMADTTRPPGNFKDRVEETAQAAREAATEVHDRAQEAGQKALHNLQEGAQAAMHRAGEVATDVSHRASEAVSRVGDKMSSLGTTLRDRGPHGGVLGQASSAMASGLETGGHYLKEQGLQGMFQDVQVLIRRFPVAALCVGVGFGFLLARATRRE